MLPVMLNLQDRRVLIVGGGVVATRRTKALLAEGALVEVVAPSCSEELELLARENSSLTLTRRGFQETDVDGAWLVLAHTDSPALQEEVRRICEEKRIWCLVGGAKEKSGFWMLAHCKIQDVVVAVSGGGNPKRAKQVLEEISQHLSQ